MFIVTREPNEGQFHISLEVGDDYYLLCAARSRHFIADWIPKLKANKHPHLWWCDNHKKAFPKSKAVKYKRNDHEFIGRTETIDHALSLIDCLMLLDDEERKIWES